MIRFTRTTLSATPAGKLIKSQRSIAASTSLKDKIKEDPHYQFKNLKAGYVRFGGRVLFVRSSWEANICAYYEFLKQQGQIREWEYEKETFWFLKIMRGTRSYKPDFKITRNDGSVYYVEVKGYMDKKSAVKLKRMKKYHPSVIIELIDKTRYYQIAEKSGFYPGWNQPLLKKVS